MAWNVFNIQTTGNNLNAGSTTADNAAATSTNGDWGNALANRFTAASGTPFSATNIGDWASVYLDAASSAVYVAQVTAVNAGGASIDLSTTQKYGTAPTTGATGRSCKVGGAMASLAGLASLLSTNVPASTQFNIKAGTYAHTTTNITLPLIGAIAFPVWIRGYNSSPGDLDNDLTTAKPLITFTTGLLTFSGNFIQVTGLSVQSQLNGTAVVFSGNSQRVDNCWFENQKATGASVVSFTASAPVVTRSWVKTLVGAGALGTLVTCSSGLTIEDCTLVGGATALALNGGTAFVTRNVLAEQVSHLITSLTGFSAVVGNSMKGGATGTGDGLRVANASGSGVFKRNVVSTVATGANNTSGTNMGTFVRQENRYFAVTTEEAGWGDTVSVGSITGGSDPFTATGSSDYSPSVAGGARAPTTGAAFPNLSTTTTYQDLGAIQHQAGGGAGRGILTGGRL